MKKKRYCILLIITLLVIFISCSQDNASDDDDDGPDPTPPVKQTKTTMQIGTGENDYVTDIALNSSGTKLYITGYTAGDFEGTNAGGLDAITAIISADDNSFILKKQFGTEKEDRGKAIALYNNGDRTDMTIGIESKGDFEEHTNDYLGSTNIYFFNMDETGLLFHYKTIQMASDTNDILGAIGLVNTDIYLTGVSTRQLADPTYEYAISDIFFAHYNYLANDNTNTTTYKYMKYIETADYNNDEATALAVSANGVYIGGSTPGTIEGYTNQGAQDLILAKYDWYDSTHLWTKQLGSSDSEYLYDIACDFSVGGHLYAVGSTLGDFDGHTNQGGNDIFVYKTNGDGDKSWSAQLGNSQSNIAYGIALDANSNAYVVGVTSGGLGVESEIGQSDAFIAKFAVNALDGTPEWVKVFGTDSSDSAECCVIDQDNGIIYVGGTTSGSLDANVNSGNKDIFIAKFDLNGNQL